MTLTLFLIVMKVVFSDHAKNQIKRRKITKTVIIGVIKKPEETRASFRGRKLLRSRFHGKILEVIIKSEDLEVIVITAYYLKEEEL